MLQRNVGRIAAEPSGAGGHPSRHAPSAHHPPATSCYRQCVHGHQVPWIPPYRRPVSRSPFHGCRRVLALIVAPLLAACITVNTEGDGDGRTTAAPDPTTTTPSSATDSPTPEPVMTMKRFQTPSGNILCESFSSSLVCVIDSGLVPEPPQKFCPVDWIGLFVRVGEYSGPGCSGDPGIERSLATELPYEQTWSRAGVTCRSEKSGLTCEDDVGNGFSLASAGWELLGKEEAARAAFGELRKLVRNQARADFAEYGHKVETVEAPVLGAADGCGGLQQAAVFLTVSPDLLYAYQACFVSGTWHLKGPIFPD